MTLFKKPAITLEVIFLHKTNKTYFLIRFREVNGHGRENSTGFWELFPSVHRMDSRAAAVCIWRPALTQWANNTSFEGQDSMQVTGSSRRPLRA